MGRLIKWVVLGLLALVVLANAALFVAIKITQDPAPRPLDAQRIFAASRPAVMLIQANYKVTISLPEATLPKASEDRLDQVLIAMVRSGKLPLQDAAIDQAAVNLLLDNPDAYFVPGATRLNDDLELVSSGSGFFASEDGYVITASHVVSASKEDIRALITDLEKKPGRLAEGRTEIQRIVREKSGITLNDSQLDKMISWQERWVDKYATVDKVDAQYYLASGTVEAGKHLVTVGTRLSLVTAEPAMPGRDVAVMKADVSSVPALALSTTTPSTGAATYAIGYPRRGYLEEAVQLDGTVAPTLSSGTLEGPRSMDGGWTAYGTSAQVTHGNSGGPVLDAQGRVLGLVSFASTDAKGNVTGDAFFVPADVIRETLNKASVKPAAGTLTNLYYQALSQGDFRHYRHELAILSQVQTRSAWHAYVKDDVSTTQSAVLSGKDQTPPVLTGLVQPGLAGLGAATLLAISTLLGLWLRGRRKVKPEAAAASSVAAEPPTNPQPPELTAVPEVGAEEISAVPEEAATETIRIA
jgi:S1-C subfamily serine protease